MADTVQVLGQSTTLTAADDSGKALLEAVKVTNGQLHVNPGLLAGENTTDDRLYGGAAPSSKTALTATGTVKASAGKLYGWIVTTALSAAAITLYDNASAASGTVIGVIPASTTAGTVQVLAAPIPCTNGIYASFGGTGTVLFLYT